MKANLFVYLFVLIATALFRVTAAGSAPSCPEAFGSDLASQQNVKMLLGNQSNSNVGMAVTLADMNGDGHTDLVVSENRTLVVVLGPVSTTSWKWNQTMLNDVVTSPSTGFVITFPVPIAALYNVGDINGDGLEDVILSFSQDSFVLFGGKNWASMDYTSVTSSQGFHFSGGVGAVSETSMFISGAGDFNGDNINDVLVGDSSTQSVHVVYGRVGLTQQSFQFPPANSSLGFTLQAPSNLLSNDQVITVVGGKDINGDGMADFVVVANAVSEGWVVFGRNTSLDAFLNQGTLTTSNLIAHHLGVLLQNFRGSSTNHFQSSVELVDLDEDGLADILIGTLPFNGYVESPMIQVLWGQVDFALQGPIDVMQATNASSTTGFAIVSNSSTAYYFGIPRNVGDVNGDGFPDLFLTNTDSVTQGGANVLYGATKSHFQDQVNVNSRLGKGGFSLQIGNFALGLEFLVVMYDQYQFLFPVTVGGRDLNGDGLDDFVTSDPTWGGQVAPGSQIPFPTGGKGAIFLFFGEVVIEVVRNEMTIQQGERIPFNVSNLDLVGCFLDVNIQVENISHGHFGVWGHNNSHVQQFTFGDVLDGLLFFQHDGSNHQPSYELHIGSMTQPQTARVTFLSNASSSSSSSSSSTPPTTSSSAARLNSWLPLFLL